MERCYNQGCGQEYDPKNNTKESCRHHPGAPFFHDAYKGWSCCNKKSVDFTEFLGIKGCTLSEHSNVKPIKTAPKEDASLNKESEKEPIVEVNSSKKTQGGMERPPFDTEMTTITATVAPNLKETIDNLMSTNREEEEIETNEEVVAIGTICKNSGCNCSYTGDEKKDKGDCQYHDGLPIFHEGMKFWSCCNRRTTDFAVFMSQPGCTHGQHVWVKKKDENRNTVKCRYDWHQTSKDVIVSIYGKNYDYAKSTIKVNPIRLQVSLIFPEVNKSIFDLDIELRGIVKPEGSRCHMFGSKVEITMPKAEPGSWPKLECPRKTAKKTPPLPYKPPLHDYKVEKCYEEIRLEDIELMPTKAHLSELARTKPHELN